MPSEDIAAFLNAQLEQADSITQRRMHKRQIYHEALENLEQIGDLRRPIIPAECQHNAHMRYILLNFIKTAYWVDSKI